MTHSSGEHIRLQERIEELEQRLKEKETYHADCLRIQQLELELAECRKHNMGEWSELSRGGLLDKIDNLEQQLAWHKLFYDKMVATPMSYTQLSILKQFEREQNE